MGGKKESAPTPQPLNNIPSPPSYGQTLSDYISNFPKLVDLEKQYGPELAQISLDLLRNYGPSYNDYTAGEQKRLQPFTYGLQEQLAKLASENSGGGIPSALRNSYLDQYRAEVGDNAGAGIGADYVSSSLARLGEDYKSHYQNLGLSLLGNQMNPATPSFASASGGLDSALGYANNMYGNYTQALNGQQFYTPAQPARSGGFSGMFGGATAGSSIGSLFGPWGTGIGAIAGGLFGARG